MTRYDMVIHAFPWDASTSVANLTESQITQLCVLINNRTIQRTSSISSTVNDEEFNGKQPAYLVWGVGLMLVTLINMCAVVGIGVMRYLTKNAYNQV
uniref:PBPe domain-containing protein n=1 Tax=Heterorhabditis bacteriophora TaxID=37862 RepID=A0A1I7WN93_HETBA